MSTLSSKHLQEHVRDENLSMSDIASLIAEFDGGFFAADKAPPPSTHSQGTLVMNPITISSVTAVAVGRQKLMLSCF